MDLYHTVSDKTKEQLPKLYLERAQGIFTCCGNQMWRDDKLIYDELNKSIDKRKIPLTQILKDEAIQAFDLWVKTENKTKY